LPPARFSFPPFPPQLTERESNQNKQRNENRNNEKKKRVISGEENQNNDKKEKATCIDDCKNTRLRRYVRKTRKNKQLQLSFEKINKSPR
jgi:phage protein D